MREGQGPHWHRGHLSTGRWQGLFLLTRTLRTDPLRGDLHACISRAHRPVFGRHTSKVTQQMFIECPLHIGPGLALGRRMNKPRVNLTSRTSESRSRDNQGIR